MILSSAAEAPAAESEPRLKGFTGEEILRLRDLRAWLTQRRLQREGGVLATPRRRPLDLAVYPDRQLLTPLGQRYALGFQTRGAEENHRNPTLFIGRDSAGRVYHRYEFGAGSAYPEGTPTNRGAGSAREPGLGNPEARRIVRLRPADSGERYAVPRLEYELR